jgi:nucleotide-binding universal stress UspA family protein
MFTHVLVPLDESPQAEKAISFALHITNPDGKITVMTVVDAPLPPSPFPVYEQAIRYTQQQLDRVRNEIFQQAAEYLLSVLMPIREHVPASNLLVRDGDAATRIVQAANELGVDAIVMSTHGRSGIGRLLLGSVAQNGSEYISVSCARSASTSCAKRNTGRTHTSQHKGVIFKRAY